MKSSTWAIPFTNASDNPYILPTSLLHEDGVFRLHGSGETIGNLKVPLLIGQMSPGHALGVIAFFALAIKHIKLWVEANKSDELAGMQPFWSINIGLPAKDLERTELVNTFTRLIWAGTSLSESGEPEVSRAEAAKALATAYRALKVGEKSIPDNGGGEVHQDQIGIFPEIAAQIYGYLKSDMWDRSRDMFLLLDVGGGTVDGAIFKVIRSVDGEIRFAFLRSSVKHLGVYILHQKRLDWHRAQLEGCPDATGLSAEISNLLQQGATPGEVPASIDEYLLEAKYPENTSDQEFYRQFRDMAWKELIQSVRATTDSLSQIWTDLPFLLCGGGRSIGLYNDFLRLLNQPGSATSVKLHEIGMRKPSSLEGGGLGEAEYQRISVAYGLSFLDIGEVLTPDKLIRPAEHGPKKDFTEKYIGPELV